MGVAWQRPLNETDAFYPSGEAREGTAKSPRTFAQSASLCAQPRRKPEKPTAEPACT